MSLERLSLVCASGLCCFLSLGCSGPAPSGRAQSSDAGKNERTSARDPNQEAAPEPLSIEKIALWENVLEKPPIYVAKPGTSNEYTVTVQIAPVQILPAPWPATPALTYGGSVRREGSNQTEEGYKSTPGPTFEMTRGTVAHVTWRNLITEKQHVLPEAQSAIPSSAQGLTPIVTHVHGLEVAPASDGAPDAWFTSDSGAKLGRTYDYPNSQPATALWYHDHTFGMTQYNVYAGLAGAYIIRDPNDAIEFPDGDSKSALPDRAHEWPLVLQDRSFLSDGSFDFFGSNITNVVNGKVWPQMPVDRTLYRFRMLNGSNERYYRLALSNKKQLTVIGTDGGYLAAPQAVDSVSLAPGERADVLIDFADSKEGELVTLNDLAARSDPSSLPDLSNPLNQLVRFKASANKPPQRPALPQKFDSFKALPSPTLASAATPLDTIKTMTLHGPFPNLLNGQSFAGAESETPTLGTTEDWDLVNLTDADHPIHLHLVQFQVLSRRTFDVSSYQAAWEAANGTELPLSQPTKPVAVVDTKDTLMLELSATDRGWKDTVDVPKNVVTRIRVRWAPQEAEANTSKDNPFGFNPTVAPGYVWHCHILGHEDNEMMRPLRPVMPPTSTITPSGPLG